MQVDLKKLFSKGKESRRRGDKGKRKKYSASKKRPDYVILVLTIVFLVFGLIMIFDASIYRADTVFDNRFYFVQQQIAWILIGTVAGGFFYFWDYHKFSKLVIPAMVVTLGLLATVFVLREVPNDVLCPSICVKSINGARRWIYIRSIPLQPAELAKPVFILYLCTWLSKTRKTFKDIREAIRFHFVYELVTFLLVMGAIGGLVVMEPDLGTTVVICFVAFVIYFSSGRDMIHTIGSLLVLVVGGLLGTLAAVLESYRLERVKTYLQLLSTGDVAEPLGSGYQMQQILIGIGSGGFWGKGFGESRQRYGYLVENTPFTDSIFAVVLEEVGMLGGIVLIALFLMFFARSVKVAMNAPDRLGKLLAGGLALWLVFQAFMHMAANVGLFPLTGIPLTFFTYGGSSTVVSLIGVGMLLNVSRFSENN